MLKASDREVGTWFRLLCYCTQQMNGGAIQNCRDWTDDMWMRAAGIRAAAVVKDGHLWHYTAMGWLVVHLYDTKSEETYRRKQKLGRAFADARWHKLRQKKIIPMSGDSKSSSGS